MNKNFLTWPRWLRYSLLGLASLMLLFWLLGRFWLPEFARQKAVAVLSETLHRPVAIGAIEIAPFALAVTVKQLSIGQRDAAHGSAPLLAFESLHVDLSSASLWNRAPVVSALRLASPRVNLVRNADGSFNYSDLLAPSAEPAPPSAGLPEFSLANIELTDGRLDFDDRMEKTRQVISELALGVPFAGTLGSQEESWVEPHFRARLDDSLLELKGKVKPFADRREATLEVKLKDLDLTRVATYAPPIEGLKLLSARLDIDLAVVFVQAPGKPYQLKVSGESALRRLELENRGGAPYVASADRIGLKLTEFDATLAKPLRAALQVDQFGLREKGAKTPLLSLPRLTASDAVVDLKGQYAILGLLSFDQLRLALRREADGRIDLLRVLLPPAKPAATARAAAAEQKPAEAKTAAPGWQGKVGRIALTDAAIRFVDQTVDKAPPLNVEGLALQLDGLDITGREPAAVSLAANVNQRGKLAVQGSAAWAPLAVGLKLDVKELDLVPLQGWAGDRFNALLSRGALSLAGQLDLAGEPMVARFAGDGRLANFNLFDRLNTADVLNFRSLDLAGLKVVSEPLAVDLKRLSLDEFFARVILGADGKLNLQQLVKQPAAAAVAQANGGPNAEAGAQAGGPAAAAANGKAAAALPVKIGEIVISKSRLDFTDRFIKPPYSASLTGLEGKVTALAAGQRGLIDLRGLVDRSAPLSISGELDPFAGDLFLNVAARVKGVDMPAMSPYAERYLGYQLDKGKLSFDVKYFVEHRQLKAENALFLDQLTFGNKVESPDALGVPVTLAVALLKNTRGEIDLNLPVAGSLNDPEFSVGRIVFKVLGNLIVKAVSSPFALLGSVFGGGEELSQVEFVAGRAALEAEGEKRLGILAKALTERPGLTLEITGHADPARDRVALAQALVERKLRAQKLASSAQKGEDSAALRDIVLTPEERTKGLIALADAQGIKLAKDAPPAAYLDALAAANPVGDDELRQLAERRGRSVRNWLVDTGKVPVERVFVMVPKVDPTDAQLAAGRAVFALR